MKMEKGTLLGILWKSHRWKGLDSHRSRKPLMMYTSGAFVQEQGWIWWQDGPMQGHQHDTSPYEVWIRQSDLKRQLLLPSLRFKQPQLHPLKLGRHTSHRACPTRVTPPAPAHQPSTSTSPKTMTTLSLSTRPSTPVIPSLPKTLFQLPVSVFQQWSPHSTEPAKQ